MQMQKRAGQDRQRIESPRAHVPGRYLVCRRSTFETLPSASNPIVSNNTADHIVIQGRGEIDREKKQINDNSVQEQTSQ